MTRVFLPPGIVLVLGILPTVVAAQTDDVEKSKYIEERFRTALKESPKMAWVLPDGTVAALDNASKIVVYSWASTVAEGYRRAFLSPERTLQFRKKHHVACDVSPDEKPQRFSLYNSTLRVANRNPQVFYTLKPLPGLKAGFRRSSLDGHANQEVWKRMKPTAPEQPRSAFVVRRDGVPYYYSFGGLYDGPKQFLSRLGIFLHSSDGQVIAAQIDEINENNLCDGCTMPTFVEGLERVFRLENMFTAPQFPYPVLMMDRSTVEGRSISLSTFLPDGKYSDYLLYEYVIGCFWTNP